MKRFKTAIVTTVVAIGLMFLGGNAWAGSSASAGAGAQSNATNSNQNSAGAIGTGGNGYGGAAQSSVSIDSHSTSNYQNRQFLNAGAVSAPTMQDFSSRTDHPWNTMEPLFGRFSKSQSAGQTIKYLHKEIIPVQTWSPAKNVTFVDNRLKVPEGAQYGGDIYVMVTKDETTTQAQILTYEPARTNGWNYCRIMSSYYRPEPKTEGHGIALGGGVSGLVGSDQKGGLAGFTGIGYAEASLKTLYSPFMNLRCYHYEGQVTAVVYTEKPQTQLTGTVSLPAKVQVILNK